MAPEGESPSDATANVAEGPKDENEEGKEEDDELAEYGLDKYDEEDTGEGMLVHSSLVNTDQSKLFLLIMYILTPLTDHSDWPCIYCLSFFNLVTANLGDSLAGLTVFSSNEEDPYITIKDTVSTQW